MQAQDIYTAYEDQKRDISDVESDTFLRWVQFTTRFIYDKVKRIDAKRFIQTQLYTVTTDPQTEDLPSDFRDLNQTSCGLYEYSTSTSKILESKLGITGYGSTDEGYYLDGSSIVFTGITEKSFHMKYLPKPPVIDSLDNYITIDTLETGAPIVEDEHMEYMLNAIDVLYEQWDTNPQGESLADFRFSRALGGILDGYNRTPQISIIRNQSDDY